MKDLLILMMKDPQIVAEVTIMWMLVFMFIFVVGYGINAFIKRR